MVEEVGGAPKLKVEDSFIGELGATIKDGSTPVFSCLIGGCYTILADY
jgi:hypothetical protein